MKLLPIISIIIFLSHSVDTVACNDQNINCNQATTLQLDSNGQPYCLSSCNDGGTNEKFTTDSDGCAASAFYTVWYKLEMSHQNPVLKIHLESSDLQTPVISLYSGSCQNLLLQNCNQGYKGSVEMRNLFLDGSKQYYLAVSDAQKIEGEYDLCVQAIENPNLCNTSSELKVMSTSLGSPASGPYHAGERVEFCYTIDSYETVGCNYLHAIVPHFGNGWDASSFDPNDQPKNITQALVTQGQISYTNSSATCNGGPTGDWRWYPSDAISYNFNSDNTLGLTSDDFIPASWVFLNGFNPDTDDCFELTEACCNNPTQNPNIGYGDDNYPICGRPTDHSWTICFELIASISPQSAASDCSVSMKTMSDGETGTFIDKSCKNDLEAIHSASVEVCTRPEIEASESVLLLCPDESFTIELTSDQEETSYWYADDLGEIHILDGNTITGKYSAEGSYNYIVGGSNGCMSNQINIAIEVVNHIDLRVEQFPEISCPDEEVKLIAQIDMSLDDSQLSYLWNQSATTHCISVDDPASTYGLEVSYYGCTATIDTRIKVFDSSTVTLTGDDLMCKDDTGKLYFDFTGEGPWSIVLEDAKGNQEQLISNQARLEKEIDAVDNIYKIVSAIDGNGCEMEIKGEVETELMPELIVSAGADTKIGCFVNEVGLDASLLSQTSDYTIEWMSLQGHQISDAESMHPLVSEPGSYVIFVTDMASGCVGIDTVDVTMRDAYIGLSLEETELEIDEGEIVELVAHIDIDEALVEEVSWSHLGSIFCEDCMTTMAAPSASEIYTLTVTDVYGCSEQVTVTVTVREKVEESSDKIYLPNTFDPYASGENRFFRLFDDNNVERIESFEIYDRWGNQLFLSSKIDPVDHKGWDGTYRGTIVSSGVYIYQISVTMKNGLEQKLTGSITIIN